MAQKNSRHSVQWKLSMLVVFITAVILGAMFLLALRQNAFEFLSSERNQNAAVAGGQASPTDAAQGGDLPGDLGIRPVFQNPDLINGCEAASLAALLQYYGFPADKLELAYDYIPRVDFSQESGTRYASHPDTAYVGDPATTKGFYCFAGPIEEGANRYLDEAGSRLRCYDLSGMGGESFEQYLSQGSPVMILCVFTI